jgi:hypothetical protein
MTYAEPTAKVIELSRDSDVVTMVLEVSSLLSEPLAPSGLYVTDRPEQEAIQLHKLKAADGNVLTFESYDHVGNLPSVGTNYIFRVWWTPDQLEVVTDTSRKWSYENYPDKEDHDHCRLTWEAIGADAEHKAGYRCGKEWITEQAYETYIVRDKLRLRDRAKSG